MCTAKFMLALVDAKVDQTNTRHGLHYLPLAHGRTWKMEPSPDRRQRNWREKARLAGVYNLQSPVAPFTLGAMSNMCG